VMDFSQDGDRNIQSLDVGQTLNLAFGAMVIPLYDGGMSGQFAADYQGVDLALYGAMIQTDIEDIEVPGVGSTLMEFIGERPMDVDLDGDGEPDAWSFVMELHAFQFVP